MHVEQLVNEPWAPPPQLLHEVKAALKTDKCSHYAKPGQQACPPKQAGGRVAVQLSPLPRTVPLPEPTVPTLSVLMIPEILKCQRNPGCKCPRSDFSHFVEKASKLPDWPALSERSKQWAQPLLPNPFLPLPRHIPILIYTLEKMLFQTFLPKRKSSPCF